MPSMHPYNEKQKRQARARIAKIVRMRKRGDTWTEIGEKLGITRQRAAQLAKGSI